MSVNATSRGGINGRGRSRRILAHVRDGLEQENDERDSSFAALLLRSAVPLIALLALCEPRYEITSDLERAAPSRAQTRFRDALATNAVDGPADSTRHDRRLNLEKREGDARALLAVAHVRSLASAPRARTTQRRWMRV